MIVLVDSSDGRAVRNKDNVLVLYDLMINQKKSEEATANFVSAAYVQHNPLIADGSVALGNTSVRSRENAPKPGSSSIALSRSAITSGLM
jgi:predicted SnoaL-like aldol condensation-catalyzing enzyme